MIREVINKVMSEMVWNVENVDQMINNREDVANEGVTVEDSLQDKYDINIFDASNADLKTNYSPEGLFEESSYYGNNQVNTETLTAIFQTELSYNQEITEIESSQDLFLIMWLVIIVSMSFLITSILNKRRRRATTYRVSR